MPRHAGENTADGHEVHLAGVVVFDHPGKTLCKTAERDGKAIPCQKNVAVGKYIRNGGLTDLMGKAS